MIHHSKEEIKLFAERQSSESPKAKNHKSTDSNEDDEEPQNEPGTSSITQPVGPQYFLKILVMKIVNTAMDTVHKVRALQGQYSIQISMYQQMKSIGQ